MKSILIKKIYQFIWEKDSTRRQAEITFEHRDWNKGGINKFEFTECQFTGLSKIYTINDWEFLAELSAEILILENYYATKKNL